MRCEIVEIYLFLGLLFEHCDKKKGRTSFAIDCGTYKHREGGGNRILPKQVAKTYRTKNNKGY
jgi:hypothetical protein